MEAVIQTKGFNRPKWKGSPKASYGKVVVAHADEPEKIGALYVVGDFRPDVGEVLSACPCYAKRQYGGWAVSVEATSHQPQVPELGDLVMFRPFDGVIIENADIGGDPVSRLGVYGFAYEEHAVSFKGAQRVPWWDSIMAIVDISGTVLRATWDNVLIEIDAKTTSEGGILLTDDCSFENGMGTVVSVGDGCFDTKVGERVCYSYEMSKASIIGVEGSRLRFVKEGAILYKL